MAEGRVDDDRERGVAELFEEGAHRLVELSEARGCAPLGGDVRTVDDDVLDGHVDPQSSSYVATSEGPRRARRATRPTRAPRRACDIVAMQRATTPRPTRGSDSRWRERRAPR